MTDHADIVNSSIEGLVRLQIFENAKLSEESDIVMPCMVIARQRFKPWS